MFNPSICAGFAVIAIYDDLFASSKYLYASITGDDGRYVEKIELNNNIAKDMALLGEQMLAGVTHNDQIWLYDKLRASSKYLKLE
ncbi:hypothetical protein BIW53_16585 [Pseudoalteromonas byunsanensis]|uniref:Uncharacterized protein n=1 Tax=Pseudoalteromonas byunsanensis TaxID=327939 RepID=A0A1S1N2G7_9GAMM|nr:hypothetical protein BIW53_16585 [Pseudoalteromonas byunsanensis]